MFNVCKKGMLGGGIYFAPNPQKSTQYCDKFKKMLLCKVNLEESKYAQNEIFEEYCIYDIKKVLPWYILTYDTI